MAPMGKLPSFIAGQSQYEIIHAYVTIFGTHYLLKNGSMGAGTALCGLYKLA